MKAKILRDLLAPTLETAKRAAASKTDTVPILGHVLIETGPNGSGSEFRVTGSDLDLQISILTQAEVIKKGTVCVPAASLNAIVKKLPSGAEILMEEIDGTLQIKSGRAKFKLPTLPTEDWPQFIAQANNECSFEISRVQLAKILSKCSFAISQEEVRYYLNGIYIHFAEEKAGARMVAVATNGHQLAKVTVDAPSGFEAFPGLIIPRKTVSELENILKDSASSTVIVRASSNYIAFDIGNMQVESKVIDGQFPDYARVIPTDFNKQVVLETKALKQSLSHVSAISSEKGRAAKLGFGKDTLVLMVNDQTTGEATEDLDIEWVGPYFQIGFNSSYLSKIIDIIGGEFIRIQFTDPGAPSLFDSEEDNETVAVLMPMRV